MVSGQREGRRRPFDVFGGSAGGSAPAWKFVWKECVIQVKCWLQDIRQEEGREQKGDRIEGESHRGKREQEGNVKVTGGASTVSDAQCWARSGRTLKGRFLLLLHSYEGKNLDAGRLLILRRGGSKGLEEMEA